MDLINNFDYQSCSIMLKSIGKDIPIETLKKDVWDLYNDYQKENEIVSIQTPYGMRLNITQAAYSHFNFKENVEKNMVDGTTYTIEFVPVWDEIDIPDIDVLGKFNFNNLSVN